MCAYMDHVSHVQAAGDEDMPTDALRSKTRHVDPIVCLADDVIEKEKT